MILRRLARWTLLLIPIAVAAGQANNLVLDDTPLQELRGWGVTPAPLDWDGRQAFYGDSGLQVAKVYRDSGITIARLTIGAVGLYNNERREVRLESVDWALQDQIELLAAGGIHQYVLTLLSAPAYLKTYYMSAAHLLQEPNALRVECEPLLARYVGEILDRLRAKGLARPVALSIQMQPDRPTLDSGVPVTAAHGTPYSAEQWQRVLVAVRAELDRRGHQAVGLIGPETFGPSGSAGWWDRNATAPSAENTSSAALSGWAYHSDGARTPAAAAGSEKLEAILRRTRKENAIWMLSSNCSSAQSDADVLLQAFRSMRHDLVDIGASYWFWRYAFDWNPSSETLVWGRGGNQTAVYEALRTLWQAARPGAHVYRLEGRDRDTARGELEAFALRGKDQLVYVCINPTAHDVEATILGLGSQATRHVFSPQGTSVRACRAMQDQTQVMTVPARGIVIGVVATQPPERQPAKLSAVAAAN